MAKQKYLLDTNICISMLKDKYGIRSKIREIGTCNCCVSEITIAELFYGASKSQRKAERIKDVYETLRLFKVLPIYPALELYGKMVMVTANIKHFDRMDGITIENWEVR